MVFLVIRDAGCSVNSFGTWSSIKSLFVHCEATAVSFHYFRLYGGFMLNWCFWEHTSLALSLAAGWCCLLECPAGGGAC